MNTAAVSFTTRRKFAFSQKVWHTSNFDKRDGKFVQGDCTKSQKKTVQLHEINVLRHVDVFETISKLFTINYTEIFLRSNEKKLQNLIKFLDKYAEKGTFVCSIIDCNNVVVNFDQTWRGLEEISQEFEGKLLILIINNVEVAFLDDVKKNVGEMSKGRCPPLFKDCQFSLMANYDIDSIFTGNCQEIAEILENNFPSIQLFVEFPMAIFTTDPFRDVRHDFCAIRFYVEELLKKYYGNDPRPKVCVFLPIDGMLIKNIHHFAKLVHNSLLLKYYKKAQINIEELMVLLVHLTKLNLDFLNQMVNDYYSCKKIIQYLINYLRKMNSDGFLPTREEWDYHICFTEEPEDIDYDIEKKLPIIQNYPSCQGCGKKSGDVITLCEACLDFNTDKKFLYENGQQRLTCLLPDEGEMTTIYQGKKQYFGFINMKNAKLNVLDNIERGPMLVRCPEKCNDNFLRLWMCSKCKEFVSYNDDSKYIYCKCGGVKHNIELYDCMSTKHPIKKENNDEDDEKYSVCSEQDIRKSTLTPSMFKLRCQSPTESEVSIPYMDNDLIRDESTARFSPWSMISEQSSSSRIGNKRKQSTTIDDVYPSNPSPWSMVSERDSSPTDILESTTTGEADVPNSSSNAPSVAESVTGSIDEYELILEETSTNNH